MRASAAHLLAWILLAASASLGCSASSPAADKLAPDEPSVRIDQRDPTVGVSRSMTFTATVQALTPNTVTWSVEGAADPGSITQAGLYTAPGQTGSFVVKATSDADPNVSDTVTVTVAPVVVPPPPTSRPVRYIGAHLPELSTWTAPFFADFLKQAAPWSAAGTLNRLPANQLDANGWPTVDARILFAANMPGPMSVIVGRHKLTFTGQATVTVGDGQGCRVENAAYDAATNTTTADVVIASASANYWLNFANTWRKGDHTADATGSLHGITNARLMAEGHVYGQDFYRKEIQSMRSVFSAFQFEWPQGPGDGAYSANGTTTGVMGSGETSWSTRARPGFLGYTVKGIPWEEIVIFANTVDADIWVHIPIGADDDYVRKAFQLLRYGSDGNVPYTSQVHDPTTWTAAASWYPGLIVNGTNNRRVYVEFTNELFTYYGYGDSRGQAAQSANGDPYHLGTASLAGGTVGDRWGAAMAVRNSLIAREVWGDAAMGTTIRIVYANQADWGGWARHAEGLAYVNAVFGPSSSHAQVGPFTNPKQPVSYYFYTLAGAFYISCPLGGGGNPSATTVGDMGTLGATDGSGFLRELKMSLSVDGGNGGQWEKSIYEQQESGQAMAAQYGIKFSAYETGHGIFQYGAVRDAWNHPHMKTIFYDLLMHMLAQPNADVPMQSATVRGARPPNELSQSYSAADGFPWPLTGTAAPSQMWQAVIDVAEGR